MGGLAHASSATERLPHPSWFSTDGNSYGVRLEHRNRCAAFTNRQVAKIANGNFSATWMTRGPRSESMLPKVGELMSLLGSPRFVWFQKLKSSARNRNSLPRYRSGSIADRMASEIGRPSGHCSRHFIAR